MGELLHRANRPLQSVSSNFTQGGRMKQWQVLVFTHEVAHVALAVSSWVLVVSWCLLLSFNLYCYKFSAIRQW